MSSQMGSLKEAKAKYPLLGTSPPPIEHCAASQLIRAGNAYMVWWDCSKCFHRVMDISLKQAVETRYYAAPPCPISPNYQAGVPTPPLKVKKEVRLPTPPLNAAQARTQTTQRSQNDQGYSSEEHVILREARKILQQKGQDVTGFPTLNTGLPVMTAVASGSQGPMVFPTAQMPPSVPVTVNAPVQNLATKRAGPVLFQLGQGPSAMKAEDEISDEFTLIDQTLDAMKDSDILEELNKFEERTHMLKLTLQSRVQQPK